MGIRIWDWIWDWDWAIGIENEVEVNEINRINEDVITVDNNQIDDKLNFFREYLEHQKFKNVPNEEVSKLLNKHGYTVKEYIKLLDYVKKEHKYFIHIIGKFLGDIDPVYRSVILNRKFMTFRSMVDEIGKRKKIKDNSIIISKLIEMIYNTYPFEIIPLINFTNDIDNLYRKYNDEFLMNRELTTDANKMKARFYLKFIGDVKDNEEVFVIINKLFEYGIPLNRIKPYIDDISQRLPNKFSIHDIKKIIYNDNELKEFRIYFE